MPRYALRVAYDGGAYHGWQRQDGAATVQGRLEEVLGTLLREKIDLTAAGRTDAGVHALGQVAHFDSIHEELECRRVLLGSRALLPKDIVIRDIWPVDDDFHARFDAQWRQYRYRILREPSPFDRGTAWVVYPWPDRTVLEQCADLLRGEHDFTAYCKADSAQEQNRCLVMHSEWTYPSSKEAWYTVRANRFVHHMVRGLVGTMVRAARKGDPEYVAEVLRSRRRSEAVYTAPAQGLFLEDVGYAAPMAEGGAA